MGIPNTQTDWLNGTLKHYPTSQVTGNIILVYGLAYSYDGFLRKLAPLKPQAVILVVGTVGQPGSGMYAADGKERRSIDYPVAEAYATKKANLSDIPDGTYVHIPLETNPFRKVNEGPFHPVMMTFFSFWELAIITIGLYRIRQFSYSNYWSIFSIGPLCLLLDIMASSIRLAHTCVDPFWSQRMMPHTVQSALMTLHFPFGLSSGILLTFYCTYHASPFAGALTGGEEESGRNGLSSPNDRFPTTNNNTHAYAPKYTHFN